MKVKLHGKNRIRESRKVASELTSKLSSCDGVVGIVFVGGLVRGFVDRYSDLDVFVLASGRGDQLRKKLYTTSSLVARQFNVDIDMEVHNVEDFKRRAWSEIERWEFSKAQIAFDPHAVLKRILEEKLKLPEDYWVRRIVVSAEYLKWYCCPPKEEVGIIAESWISRGDLLSAHYCLNYSVDLMLNLIFALNKEHLPPPKWRLFCAYGLEWLPENYRRCIKDTMKTSELSAEEFNRRLKAVRKLWHSILPKVEAETGLTAEGVSAYFVRKILCINIPQI
jgi:predicted nucleotidyltransferase